MRASWISSELEARGAPHRDQDPATGRPAPFPDTRVVRPFRPLLAAVMAAALTVGCGTGGDGAARPASGEGAAGAERGIAALSADAADVEPHDHAAGAGLPPAGDGTEDYQVGYTLKQVRLPETPGEPGRLSFVIENYHGRPHTAFFTEQTKDMHVYVVREDLAVFRHVHPAMRRDGTWVGILTLPEPGDYRVVTEFLAEDEGGYGDFVMLGSRATVPGDWTPAPLADEVTETAGNWGVRATALDSPAAEVDDLLRVSLSRADAPGPVDLGRYLGTSAHLTGFHVDSGAVAHLHPTGEPKTSESGTELEFHTRLPSAGRYVMFLQVRVDDFLHTLPLRVVAS
jgi:hypothetical protein